MEFQIDVRRLLKERELMKAREKNADLREEEVVSLRYLNRSLGALLIRGIFEFSSPFIIALYSMALLWRAYFPAN